MSKAWHIYLKGDGGWSSIVFAETRGRAKSLFYGYWKSEMDEISLCDLYDSYTDIRTERLSHYDYFCGGEAVFDGSDGEFEDFWARFEDE
jgi:hypothetical protein